MTSWIKIADTYECNTTWRFTCIVMQHGDSPIPPAGSSHRQPLPIATCSEPFNRNALVDECALRLEVHVPVSALERRSFLCLPCRHPFPSQRRPCGTYGMPPSCGRSSPLAAFLRMSMRSKHAGKYSVRTLFSGHEGLMDDADLRWMNGLLIYESCISSEALGHHRKIANLAVETKSSSILTFVTQIICVLVIHAHLQECQGNAR